MRVKDGFLNVGNIAGWNEEPARLGEKIEHYFHRFIITYYYYCSDITICCHLFVELNALRVHMKSIVHVILVPCGKDIPSHFFGVRENIWGLISKHWNIFSTAKCDWNTPTDFILLSLAAALSISCFINFDIVWFHYLSSIGRYWSACLGSKWQLDCIILWHTKLSRHHQLTF